MKQLPLYTNFWAILKLRYKVTKKKFKKSEVHDEISTFWKFSTSILSQRNLFRDLEDYNFYLFFDEITCK
jgi:hypothetical protein